MVSLDPTRLDDTALMDLWDGAQPLPRPWRELAVLEACCDESRQTLARVPIGIRDSLLLDVRVHLFGRRVEAESKCAACGERLDVAFDVNDILAARAVTDPAAFELRHGTTVLRLRLPDSTDIAAAARAPDPERAVLSRCVEVEEPADADVLADEDLRRQIVARFAEMDPQAETVLAVTCPACAVTRECIFDPAGFLLAEIASYADRLVTEVDQLARAYGWREADILALGSRRRGRYLELTS